MFFVGDTMPGTRYFAHSGVETKMFTVDTSWLRTFLAAVIIGTVSFHFVGPADAESTLGSACACAEADAFPAHSLVSLAASGQIQMLVDLGAAGEIETSERDVHEIDRLLERTRTTLQADSKNGEVANVRLVFVNSYDEYNKPVFGDATVVLNAVFELTDGCWVRVP